MSYFPISFPFSYSYFDFRFFFQTWLNLKSNIFSISDDVISLKFALSSQLVFHMNTPTSQFHRLCGHRNIMQFFRYSSLFYGSDRAINMTFCTWLLIVLLLPNEKSHLDRTCCLEINIKTQFSIAIFTEPLVWFRPSTNSTVAFEIRTYFENFEFLDFFVRQISCLRTDGQNRIWRRIRHQCVEHYRLRPFQAQDSKNTDIVTICLVNELSETVNNSKAYRDDFMECYMKWMWNLKIL